MKFSVLLPTRNRLELLKFALETVIRQEYRDWEVVVSDNDSSQDIPGYLHSLNEPRIRYVRTASFVPVTDNWNNALKNCSGDYIIMLGDDDCLLNSFFESTAKLIEEFNSPDCIYSNALLYAYPNVMPGNSKGFLQRYDHAPFFRNLEKPSLLAKKHAQSLAKQSMHMKMPFTYNMQHSVVSRNFIRCLENKGDFFQSPYPDFYATNVIFLKADSIVLNPQPMVVVGISPKSFGYYYFNDQEEAGIDFLNNLPSSAAASDIGRNILPGQGDKTSWLIAMETIKKNYGSEMKLHVGYGRYRLQQIIYVYRRYRHAKHNRPELLKDREKELESLKNRLTAWERVCYLGTLSVLSCLVSAFPQKFRHLLSSIFLSLVNKSPKLEIDENTQNYENILEVFERADPARIR